MPDQDTQLPKISVVLIDDHKIVRHGVAGFLAMQPDIHVLAEGGSGADAVALVAEHAPDVLLMDLIMPEMDGVEATRAVKQASPRTHVIVLTSYHQDEHIFPAIRAGALSYILKDIEPEELAEAIRRAAVGEATLHPRVAARLVEEVHGARHASPNPFTELSDRELEVLRLIATGQSNASIAEVLVISERTVKNHVSNILSKLHVADRTQAAVMAWREGVMRRSGDG